MISNYSQFLLLETKIEFLNDFKKILLKLKTTSIIAKHLLEIIDKDIKISTSYIDITDKDDMVSFLNTNGRSTKYEIIDNECTYTGYIELFKVAGLTGHTYPTLPDGTKGEVIRIITSEDFSRISKDIAHFVSDSGENCLISTDGIRKVMSGKRQEAKIGRISSNLLRASGIEFTNKEMEDFVNQYKSKIKLVKDKFHRFELVKENRIRTFYHEDRHTSTHRSTLHDSCMRYNKCQKYIEIYCANPEVCSLLILESEDEPDTIDARALVWKLTDGTIFMDRIYSSQDFQIEMFKEYARSNGWCYKCKQDNIAEGDIEFKPATDEEEFYYTGNLTVKLEESNFTYYPYMDTLKYVNTKYDTLSNNESYGSKLLEDIDGGAGDDCDGCEGEGMINCLDCGGTQEIECPRCDGTGFEDCHTCDSTGNTECPDCDGMGKTFDGSTEFDCDNCHGTGEITCQDCNGSREVTCSKCGGDCEVECQTCNCDGRIECPNCDGTGVE